MTQKTLEQVVLELGFDSEKQFHEMVAAVDCSSPLKICIFKVWQENSGTKAGLERVLVVCGDRRRTA